jgi:hypothetical protein
MFDATDKTGHRAKIRAEMMKIAIGLLMAVLAQVPASDRLAITRYQSAIKTGAVESAFNELTSLGQTLPRVLESLSDRDFEQLQRDLPGAIVSREEILVVQPNVDYFDKLAATQGDAVDRRFFAALKTIYPESVWPAYVEQQTDYSGCTAFGSGTLVEAYRVWSQFQTDLPNRYAGAVERELDRVSSELAESTCACGNPASIQSELERFIQIFPNSPIRVRVEERLNAVKAGKSNIRAGCISG